MALEIIKVHQPDIATGHADSPRTQGHWYWDGDWYTTDPDLRNISDRAALSIAATSAITCIVDRPAIMWGTEGEILEDISCILDAHFELEDVG